MADETILHQNDVETVIDAEIEAGVGKDHTAIVNVAAPSSSYVQAEATAARNAINSILTVLRDNGMVASS